MKVQTLGLVDWPAGGPTAELGSPSWHEMPWYMLSTEPSTQLGVPQAAFTDVRVLIMGSLPRWSEQKLITAFCSGSPDLRWAVGPSSEMYGE